MTLRRQLQATFSSRRCAWRSGVALAFAVALVACITDPDNPAGTADASADGHVASSDAGSKDAGHDATIEDAGTDATETSAPDAGRDTSAPDASVPDTGVPDTSIADAGAPDTSVADTSVADTSVADTSVPDTSVADTSVADTSIPDTSVVDAGVLDTGADGAGPPPGGLGPTAYLSFADSPFKGNTLGYFYLEDFEDHLLNTPGVTANGVSSSSSTSDPTLIDSVDGDDGDPTNGKCAKAGNCDAWFSPSGDPGLTFTFNAATLGALPTHVGIVWTDGGGAVTFKAFDATGLLVGSVGPSSDPPNFPDTSFYGTTGEDRFFGIVFPGGVQSITISNSSGGIETDHLQYGR